MKGIHKKTLLIIFTLLFINTFVQVEYCQAQTNNLTTFFYPSDDSYISNLSKSQNYGDKDILIIKNNYGYNGNPGYGHNILIKFDNLSLLENETILSAILRLYYYETWDETPNNRSLTMYRLSDLWHEGNITWNNKPSESSNNISYTLIPNSTETWIGYNLTDEVKKIQNNTIENNGWIIKDENYWGQFNIPTVSFISKDSNQTLLKPYIEIKLLNYPPKSSFTYEIENNGTTVNFTDQSTDNDSNIISWLWDFGDGNKSHLQNPVHNYKNIGFYKVNLTVSDISGSTNKTSKTIQISQEKIASYKIEQKYELNLNHDIMKIDLDNDDIPDMFKDPNDLLTEERFVLINNTQPSFIISISEAIMIKMLWNTYTNNIYNVKPIFSPTITNINTINDEKVVIDISISKNNWSYVIMNDNYPNLTCIKVLRSDGTNVPSYYIWRENNSIFFLDDPDTKYQIILYNNTDVNTSESEINLIWALFGLIILIIINIFLFKYKEINRFIKTLKNQDNDLKKYKQFLQDFDSKHSNELKNMNNKILKKQILNILKQNNADVYSLKEKINISSVELMNLIDELIEEDFLKIESDNKISIK